MTTGSRLLRTLRRLPGRTQVVGLATVAALLAVTAASAAVSSRVGLVQSAGDPFLNASVASLDDTTETVVLGSSHVFCNVRAAEIDSPTVPLAMPNAKQHHLHQLATAAVDRCPNLKLVLIETSAVTVLLRTDRLDEFEAEKTRQLDTALGREPDRLWDRTLQRMRRSPWLAPLASRETLTPEWLLNQRAISQGDRIFEPGFHGWADTVSLLVGEGENATVHALMNASDAGPGIRDLSETVAMLQKRGVAVRLLRTPHYPSYATHQSDAMRRAVEEATAAVDAPLWDDFAMPFSREQWFDEDHLNVVGATAYTATLSDRIAETLRQTDGAE